MAEGTIEVFLTTNYPDLERVEQSPLFDKGKPLHFLTEEGYRRYAQIVERRDLLLTVASTFEPLAWRRVYLELENLMDEKLDFADPRTLDSLLGKGVNELTFEWGQTRFILPIKDGRIPYKERLKFFEGWLFNQEAIAKNDLFRTRSKERWVSPANLVYLNTKVASLLLEAYLSGIGASLPKSITLSNINPIGELNFGDAVEIPLASLLSRPSAQNSALYWLFLSQAKALEKHYIKPEKDMKKLTSLGQIVPLPLETVYQKDILGEIEAESMFKVYKVENYKEVIETFIQVLGAVDRKVEGKPRHRFRTETMVYGPFQFEVDYALGVEGTYLSTSSYRLLYKMAHLLVSNKADKPTVSLHMAVSGYLPQNDLREFFLPPN